MWIYRIFKHAFGSILNYVKYSDWKDKQIENVCCLDAFPCMLGFAPFPFDTERDAERPRQS